MLLLTTARIGIAAGGEALACMQLGSGSFAADRIPHLTLVSIPQPTLVLSRVATRCLDTTRVIPANATNCVERQTIAAQITQRYDCATVISNPIASHSTGRLQLTWLLPLDCCRHSFASWAEVKARLPQPQRALRLTPKTKRIRQPVCLRRPLPPIFFASTKAVTRRKGLPCSSSLLIGP